MYAWWSDKVIVLDSSELVYTTMLCKIATMRLAQSSITAIYWHYVTARRSRKQSQPPLDLGHILFMPAVSWVHRDTMSRSDQEAYRQKAEKFRPLD